MVKTELKDADIAVINDGSIDNTAKLAMSTGKAFVAKLTCKSRDRRGCADGV